MPGTTIRIRRIKKKVIKDIKKELALIKKAKGHINLCMFLLEKKKKGVKVIYFKEGYGKRFRQASKIIQQILNRFKIMVKNISETINENEPKKLEEALYVYRGEIKKFLRQSMPSAAEKNPGEALSLMMTVKEYLDHIQTLIERIYVLQEGQNKAA